MFSSVNRLDMPAGEVLSQAHSGRSANITPVSTDCFSCTLSKSVTLTSFVYAFYSNWFFKIELNIIGFFARMPSSDQQATELLQGLKNNFSAWELEYRDEQQLVMADKLGATKQWFMVKQINSSQTILYFGSAIMPRVKPDGTQAKPPVIFKLLGGFHQWYSKALLSAAVKKLMGNLK